MTCPECNKDKIHQFDKFCIEKNKRCTDCQKRWEARPENDPDNKHFHFTFTSITKDWVDIYAPTKSEAVEEFESSQEYDEYDVEEITKK